MTTQQQYFHVDDIDNFNNDINVQPVHYTKQPAAAAAAHSFKQVRIFLKASSPLFIFSF